jgi:signal transduction histidine kinase
VKVPGLLGEAGDALRAPLWTIMASAQLLLRSRDLSASDARLVDRIGEVAHRLAHTVRDVREEALARTGIRMALAPAATHMRLIADEVLVDAKVDLRDRWIIDGGAEDGIVEWDHDRVVQLLSNLLTHALDRSSGATPVSFAWWGEGDEMVIEIEYDPECAAGRREWTLGLSVAREIALGHGGDLSMIDSRSGRLLRVVLPRKVPSSARRR